MCPPNIRKLLTNASRAKTRQLKVLEDSDRSVEHAYTRAYIDISIFCHYASSRLFWPNAHPYINWSWIWFWTDFDFLEVWWKNQHRVPDGKSAFKHMYGILNWRKPGFFWVGPSSVSDIINPFRRWKSDISFWIWHEF